jgi:hypothetical protein
MKITVYENQQKLATVDVFQAQGWKSFCAKQGKRIQKTSHFLPKKVDVYKKSGMFFPLRTLPKRCPNRTF